jgi:hypothetical protein
MAKLFNGKETPAEEMAEAKALKSGKISKGQYVKGEKSEGHGKEAKAKADAIKSGKMSPKQYADMEKEEGKKKMANGGMACSPKKKMANGGYAERDVRSKTDGWAAHGSRQFQKKADGGMMSKCMPGQAGTGRRSNQDYGK